LLDVNFALCLRNVAGKGLQGSDPQSRSERPVRFHKSVEKVLR